MQIIVGGFLHAHIPVDMHICIFIAWLQVFPLSFAAFIQARAPHCIVLQCTIRYMHSGPDICTAGLSVMITPGPQAINQI